MPKSEAEVNEIMLLTMQLAGAARDALSSWSEMKLSGRWQSHEAAMKDLRAALVAFGEPSPSEPSITL